MTPKRYWICWACFALAYGEVFADQPTLIRIAPQPLGSALHELVQQSGLQILYPAGDPIERLMVGGVSATSSAEQALRCLLEGSGLEYQFVNARTVTISEGKIRSEETSTNRAGSRLASLSESDGPVSASSSPETEQAQTQSTKAQGIPEVLIEGSQSLNADIARSVDDIQPYVVLSREMIESSGANNIQDLLKSHLTMNYAALDNNQSSSFGLGNSSAISLRGLSSDQTLILIDGRRPVGLANFGSASQPDLNAIPLESIERIEVLPATASGIYGGSATGGVINVILRRDYTGLATRLKYENTETNNGGSRALDVTGGANFDGGNTSLIFRGSVAHTDPLYNQDRSFYAERSVLFNKNLIANEPGFLEGGYPIAGATSNVPSSPIFDPITGLFVTPNLSLKTGQELNSPITYVPYGYAGASSDGGLALLKNAGQYNLAPSATTQGLQGSLLGATTIESASATLRQQISPRSEVFLDVSASKNFNVINSLSVSNKFFVPSGAPNNPFQQDIVVNVPLLGISGNNTTANETKRVLTGLKIALGGGWKAEADFAFDRADLSFSLSAFNVSDALSTAVASGQIDALRDVNQARQNLKAFELPDTRILPNHSTQKDATFHLAGPLLNLPGGPAILSILGEWRHETYGGFEVTASDPFGVVSPIINLAAESESVSSVYAELRAPLVSETNKLPGLHLFEVQLAGRFDDYRRIGTVDLTDPSASNGQPFNHFNSIDPTIGFRMSPLSDVMFRASYGTGFLPPDLASLHRSPPVVAPSGSTDLTDPRRGNEPLGDVSILTGGNPALAPEKSETISAGVVLTPTAMPGLRASIDWTKITKKGDLATVFFSQDSINQESENSSIVIRAPVTAENDPNHTGFGPITGFNGAEINAAHARSESFDFSFDYLYSTSRAGQWDLGVLATRLLHSQVQFTPISSADEYAGTLFAPNLKANAILAWSQGALKLSWITSYYGPYFLNQTHSLDIFQGSDHIPSRIYHDLTGSINLGRRGAWISNIEIQAGVKDLLNTSPYYIAESASHYDSWGDPRMRTFFVALRAKW